VQRGGRCNPQTHSRAARTADRRNHAVIALFGIFDSAVAAHRAKAGRHGRTLVGTGGHDERVRRGLYEVVSDRLRPARHAVDSGVPMVARRPGVDGAAAQGQLLAGGRSLPPNAGRTHREGASGRCCRPARWYRPRRAVVDAAGALLRVDGRVNQRAGPCPACSVIPHRAVIGRWRRSWSYDVGRSAVHHVAGRQHVDLTAGSPPLTSSAPSTPTLASYRPMHNRRRMSRLDRAPGGLRL
jgi:hypothetical protein